MQGKIRFKFSTKDCWGKLKYYTKTIITELPTDEHGFTLMNECTKLAKESVNAIINFYQVLWVQTSGLKEVK